MIYFPSSKNMDTRQFQNHMANASFSEDHQMTMTNENNFFEGSTSDCLNKNTSQYFNSNIRGFKNNDNSTQSTTILSRQQPSSLLNKIREKNFHVNMESSGSNFTLMDFVDPDFEEIRVGSNPMETSPSKVGNVTLSKTQNIATLNRNERYNSLFSESSKSGSSSNTCYSNLDSVSSSVFQNSFESNSSDSLNSEASNGRYERIANYNNFDSSRLNEQEARLMNMSTMSGEQFWQAFNIMKSVLQIQQNMETESISTSRNDTVEWETRNRYNVQMKENDAQFTWSGSLPKRSYQGPYSSKVFVGGIPWDISEDILIGSFCHFGPVKAEWPGKEVKVPPKGFAYIIFENESRANLLLNACNKKPNVNEGEGNFYFKIPSRKWRLKEVQVIPWSIEDSSYSPLWIYEGLLDPAKTVWVGALHGMMNAEGLFRVMNDLFGGVIYAGICTDKNKYPTGSGQVAFDNYKSYVKAVTAGYVNIITPTFKKRMQVDPYLEDTCCSTCQIQSGQYFCRKNGCFRYFCRSCWIVHHASLRLSHRPLTKNKNCTFSNAMTKDSSY